MTYMIISVEILPEKELLNACRPSVCPLSSQQTLRTILVDKHEHTVGNFTIVAFYFPLFLPFFLTRGMSVLRQCGKQSKKAEYIFCFMSSIFVAAKFTSRSKRRECGKKLCNIPPHSAPLPAALWPGSVQVEGCWRVGEDQVCCWHEELWVWIMWASFEVWKMGDPAAPRLHSPIHPSDHTDSLFFLFLEKGKEM